MQRIETGAGFGFLDPHHLDAARRVARLYERAHLTQRVTMRYAPVPVGDRQASAAGDISTMAAEARKALADIHKLLPRDCAAVVMDVCCYEKGLQAIEAERGWPRRSAKLVLRIGLDQLAERFGLTAAATGPRSENARAWLGQGARPTEVG